MPSTYLPSQELLMATEVAAFLNRPLLLSGEPGTGKTKYADHLSSENKKDKFVFNTKSASISRDLFYSYDTIGHFADKEKSAIEFITLEALGKAIVNAYGTDKIKHELLEAPTHNAQRLKLRALPDKDILVDRFLKGCNGVSSIVLIDEVDKASRDFPNDILNEIEYLQFDMRELDLHISLSQEDKTVKDKIFVLLTSNFEKNLPDAFLRRCVYHHIQFREDVDVLSKIVRMHVPELNEDDLQQRIQEFISIRNNSNLQKKPATSELIDCIKWLTQKQELSVSLLKNKAALSTLLKKHDDWKLYV